MIEKKAAARAGSITSTDETRFKHGEDDDRHDHGLRNAVEIEAPARRCDRDHDDEDEIGGRWVDNDDSEQGDAEPDGGVVPHESERKRPHERRAGEDHQTER